MTYSRFSAAAIVLAGLALTGCGLTSSPADGLNFKAPQGWQGSPGIMGFMQFWKSPSDDKEVLMLFKSPKPLKTDDVFSNANMKDQKIETQRHIKICGNQPAEFFKATATSSKGGDNTVQMVMTNASGTTYIAMYFYPVGMMPNGDAANALRQLCPKP